MLEWRRSRSFAWVVEGSILLSQSAEGQAKTTYTYDEGLLFDQVVIQPEINLYWRF